MADCQDNGGICPADKSDEDYAKNGGNGSAPTAQAELLNSLPPEARKVVDFAMMSMHRVGPVPNPFLEKITEKHIDKILDMSEKSDDLAFKDAGQNRKYNLLYFIVIVALFVFLTVFLVGPNSELYKEILKIAAIYLGGLGSGYGVKSYFDRRN